MVVVVPGGGEVVLGTATTIAVLLSRDKQCATTLSREHGATTSRGPPGAPRPLPEQLGGEWCQHDGGTCRQLPHIQCAGRAWPRAATHAQYAPARQGGAVVAGVGGPSLSLNTHTAPSAVFGRLILTFTLRLRLGFLLVLIVVTVVVATDLLAFGATFVGLQVGAHARVIGVLSVGIARGAQGGQRRRRLGAIVHDLQAVASAGGAGRPVATDGALLEPLRPALREARPSNTTTAAPKISSRSLLKTPF
ncbi:hypothetical protein E2C01_017131 [Portunus trituberculatus]|uniref:Uncharacterized protein n=1 Tax=Portunus trituberculatus TaxID=210409 RepID=A0A5B7DRL8_PORTR|nr:hypothetical protein [Portunus trituberculatus]